MTTLVLVVSLSLAVSFVCSLLEAALLSVSQACVALLEEDGNPAGRMLARLRSRIDEPIAAILTLNTIAHTVGAAVSGAIALQVFGSQWMVAFEDCGGIARCGRQSRGARSGTAGSGLKPRDLLTRMVRGR
jgi:CBS domain containing-hemolysin-like protein